ncbi:MAG: HD domain-containing phosphohydrolase [Actinomycetota bacterium]
MGTSVAHHPANSLRTSRHSAWSRHLLLVLFATSVVTALPVAGAKLVAVISGVDSVVLSVAIGVILSFAVSAAGARLWSSMTLSEDIVFSELMLWGWLRRLRSDSRLERATQLLGLDGKGWAPGSELSPAEQADILQDLALSLEMRDPYTYGHSKRVTRYSYAIARGMSLDAALVENIRVAASLHDIGKLHVPIEILRKPGALSDQEFEAIKEHPVSGAEIVTQLGNPEITEMIRHHHERLDGRGYPDRLAGDSIPLGARIIAVADTFDAICSTRSYRTRANHKKALTILKKEAGSQLDREAVEAFVTYYSGRRSPEWRALVTTLPQRLFAALIRSIEGGVAQSAAAAAVAVTIATVPSSVVPDAIREHFDRDRAQHSSSPAIEVVAAVTQAAADADGRGTVQGSESTEGPPNPSRNDSGDGAGDEVGEPTTVPVDDPVAAPIGEPARPGPEPIGEPTDPVTDPVTKPIEEVTDPVTDPVTKPIEDVTDPLTDPLGDIAEAISDSFSDFAR